MIGVLILALTVAVIYATLASAAERQPPPEPTGTIPGTTLPCSTGNCGRPAVTIAAGRLACDGCAQYLTVRALGA